MSEFNLVKFAKDKGEDEETIEGLGKAFGGFFQKPKESASDRLAEIWLSPQEKAARQAVRIVKYIKDELGLEIHQIPPKLMPPIMEGIAYGYNDESIQSKWRKLLEQCIAGKDLRAEYVRILDKLDPFDARLLDYVYKHRQCRIDELRAYTKIPSQGSELDISLGKISEELRLCVITNNALGSHRKGDLESSRTMISGNGGFVKSCTIETNENKRPGNEKVCVTIHFSPLGNGFMKCITTELKTNPPSDISAQTSAS